MPDTSEENEKPASQKKRGVADRWTPKLSKGWTPVADVFLKNYRKMDITTPEAMLIIQLMLHKWGEEAPYPRFKTLATRMGISDTAVRGHARSLQKKNLLIRETRINNSTVFHLEPLFKALEALPDEPKKKSYQKKVPAE